MGANKYANWSLSDLKSAAAAVAPTSYEAQIAAFERGAASLVAIQDELRAALQYLAGGWSGTAAQAAATNAGSTIASVTQTRTIAYGAGEQTTDYMAKIYERQRAVAAVDDVETGWGAAAKGGLAGLPLGPMGSVAGAGLAAFEAHQRYEKHRAQAAKLVAEMDADGEAHANTMNTQGWAPGKPSFEPPGALPPPPGASSDTRTAGSDPGYADGARYTRDQGGPGVHRVPESSSEGSVVRMPDPPRGEVRPPGGDVPVQPSAPSGTAVAAAPDVGSGVVTSAAPTASPAATASAGPAGGTYAPSGTVVGGGAAALAVGAGALSGLRPPIGAPAAGRGAAVAGNGPGSSGSSSGRESGIGRRPVAEPGTAGSANASRPAQPAPVLREATGSPTGGYPAGGSGARRDDEDELRARPDYLVETDDIWGDGRLASPPVLG